MTQASCLCRGVRWASDGPFEWMSHCHCSRCRKAHGVGFATWVAAPSDGFRLLEGAPLVRGFESSPGFTRPFCGRCGSVVPGDPQGDRIFLPAGNFDDDPGARPVAHIFVGSKAPWHAIADALPTFETMPPDFDGPSLPELAHTGPSDDPAVVRGSCLCGAVAYEIDGPSELLMQCHCSRCRKARSAAHGANLFAEPERFRWLRGEDRLEAFPVPGALRFTHTFCDTCGSPMPRVRGDAVVVPAGSLDGDPGARPKAHIFVASKAPWYELPDDGIPRLAEGPPPR